MAMSSASATRLSATVALPAILKILLFPLEDREVKDELVAGHHRPAEAHLVQGHEVEGPVA